MLATHRRGFKARFEEYFLFLPSEIKATTRKITTNQILKAFAVLPAPAHKPSAHTMAPTTRADTKWAVDRAVSLLEVWALVAAFSGLIGAWRLLGVCRAARAGAKEFLGTLPRLVLCGGHAWSSGGPTRETWGLDLATLRWEAMPALVCARYGHACCVVRGALVVLGGMAQGGGSHQGFAPTSRVEMLSRGAEAFVELPPLSCGAMYLAAAIVVDESESALGKVLLIGGCDPDLEATSAVRLVDLATGVCTPQAPLLHARCFFAAAGLPDGRIACAGGFERVSTAEMWGPPLQGAHNAAWTWKALPAMSAGRHSCSGCVLSDGRFAVIGSRTNSDLTSSCEVLSLVHDGIWEPLPPMHDLRLRFACVAVAGCIIVAGGYPHGSSAEVFDEALGRWLRLPCALPHAGGLLYMGNALL
jgi:hypothetical protein